MKLKYKTLGPLSERDKIIEIPNQEILREMPLEMSHAESHQGPIVEVILRNGVRFRGIVLKD